MSDAIIGLSLDRSGSMRSMWDEAVEGFNRFKNEQAEAEGTAWIILNYFNEQHRQRYFAWDANDIPDLPKDDEEIQPGGMTALLQSTALTINDVEKWLTDNSWFDGKVFVVVITDGHENASAQEAREAAKRLIKEKEEEGWEFIYLAANVDTEATARDYGFNLRSSMTYDGASVGDAYGTLSSAVTRSRITNSAVEFDESERDVRS